MILQNPSWQHWLGTDSLGRDYLWRVLTATGNSLCIVMAAESLSLVFGILYGLKAATTKGTVGRGLFSLMDIYTAIPNFIMVFLVAVVLQEKLSHSPVTSAIAVIVAISLSGWASIARSVRAEILRLNNEMFVQASQALGATKWQIFRNQNLPFLKPLVFTLMCSQIPVKLMLENTLGIVGLGLPDPAPTLGKLLAESWGLLEYYPHLMLAPAAVITFIIFIFRSPRV